jgi:hypothetical protein
MTEAQKATIAALLVAVAELEMARAPFRVTLDNLEAKRRRAKINIAKAQENLDEAFRDAAEMMAAETPDIAGEKAKEALRAEWRRERPIAAQGDCPVRRAVAGAGWVDPDDNEETP